MATSSDPPGVVDELLPNLGNDLPFGAFAWLVS